jgi:hypothetical protein
VGVEIRRAPQVLHGWVLSVLGEGELAAFLGYFASSLALAFADLKG